MFDAFTPQVLQREGDGVLAAARARDIPRMCDTMQGLADRYGPVGIADLLCFWAERCREHATGGQPLPQGTTAWAQLSGPPGSADVNGFPPLPVAWAGGFLTAYLVGGRQAALDVLTMMPGDPDGDADCVINMLMLVAQTLEELPAGYALLAHDMTAAMQDVVSCGTCGKGYDSPLVAKECEDGHGGRRNS